MITFDMLLSAGKINDDLFAVPTLQPSTIDNYLSIYKASSSAVSLRQSIYFPVSPGAGENGGSGYTFARDEVYEDLYIFVSMQTGNDYWEEFQYKMSKATGLFSLVQSSVKSYSLVELRASKDALYVVGLRGSAASAAGFDVMKRAGNSFAKVSGVDIGDMDLRQLSLSPDAKYAAISGKNATDDNETRIFTRSGDSYSYLTSIPYLGPVAFSTENDFAVFSGDYGIPGSKGACYTISPSGVFSLSAEISDPSGRGFYVGGFSRDGRYFCALASIYKRVGNLLQVESVSGIPADISQIMTFSANFDRLYCSGVGQKIYVLSRVKSASTLTYEALFDVGFSLSQAQVSFAIPCIQGNTVAFAGLVI